MVSGAVTPGQVCVCFLLLWIWIGLVCFLDFPGNLAGTLDFGVDLKLEEPFASVLMLFLYVF